MSQHEKNIDGRRQIEIGMQRLLKMAYIVAETETYTAMIQQLRVTKMTKCSLQHVYTELSQWIDMELQRLRGEVATLHREQTVKKSPQCCGCPSFPHVLCGPCVAFNYGEMR